MSDSVSVPSRIEDLGEGKFAIHGDLSFRTVASILAVSKTLFASHDRIHVDMAAVRTADSAGLALLLEWLSWARACERRIEYENIPQPIVAIARISDVAELIGAGGRGNGD